MGFLLGAFGKLAAGRRVRDLQARMMRVQTKMRRATRQIETMSKMLEAQKKAEINMWSVMNQMASSALPSMAAGYAGLKEDQLAKFMGVSGLNMTGDSSITPEDQKAYGKYQMYQTQLKANNEIFIAQMKQQVEEKYENLNDIMLQPLKDEEDSLQTEKDSLESQIQIAQADYEACKKMEQADAKNLAPNYTGQA